MQHKEIDSAKNPEEVIKAERIEFIRQISKITAFGVIVLGGISLFSNNLLLWVYLILAGILFFISYGKFSLIRKSILINVGFYSVALIQLAIYGLNYSSVLNLILVGFLAITLFSQRNGKIIIGSCIITWLGAGLFFSFYPTTPVINTSNTDIIQWISAAINMVLVLITIIQSRMSTYKIFQYASDVASERRELQEIRSELLSKQKSVDYERYLLYVLMDNVSDRIFFKDTAGHYTRVSKALARQFGVSPEEVISKTDSDFFAPDYAQSIKNTEEDMVKTNQTIIDKVEKEVWLDGRPHTWSITNRILLRDPEGKIIGFFGTSRNITEIKKAQETAQRYAHQLATISEVGRSVTSTIILTDLLDNLVNLLRRSFGYYAVNVWLKNEAGDQLKLETCSGVANDNVDGTDLVLPLEKRSIITNVCKSGRYRLVYDVINDAPDYIPLSMFPDTRSKVVLPLRMGDNVFGVLDIHSDKLDTFVYNDVLLLQTLADQVSVSIENARLFSKVEYLATNDALSGLYNRRYLFELARIEVERSSRYSCNLSAVILDIDHFKKVNDTYGHPVGDQIIHGVGEMLRKSLRTIDIVGRYGGEEFVFLLPETDLPQAELVATRLCRKCAETVFDTTGGPVKITISLGVAKLEPNNTDLSYLLDCADKAMYRAKQTGRNKVVIYNKEEFQKNLLEL